PPSASAPTEPAQVIRREAAPPRPPAGRRQPPPVVPSTRPRPTRATAPPPRPAAPKTRRKRRWGRLLAVSLLLAVLAASAGIVAGAVWFDTSLRREPALTDYADRPAAGRGTNWLLVGSDSRHGLSAEQQQAFATGGDIGNGRTDTILLI